MSLFNKNLKFLKKEDEDIKRTKQIKSALLKLETKLDNFKNIIYSDNYNSKEHESNTLHKQILEFKIKINKLIDNVKEIMLLEKELETTLAINDKQYINQKFNSINYIEERIKDMINILESQPSIQELKSTMIERLHNNLEEIGSNIATIEKDNKKLKMIYKNIQNKVLN